MIAEISWSTFASCGLFLLLALAPILPRFFREGVTDLHLGFGDGAVPTRANRRQHRVAIYRLARADEVIELRWFARVGDDFVELPSLGDEVHGRLDARLRLGDRRRRDRDDGVVPRLVAVRAEHATNPLEAFGECLDLLRREREHEVAIGHRVATLVLP